MYSSSQEYKDQGPPLSHGSVYTHTQSPNCYTLYKKKRKQKEVTTKTRRIHHLLQVVVVPHPHERCQNMMGENSEQLQLIASSMVDHLPAILWSDVKWRNYSFNAKLSGRKTPAVLRWPGSYYRKRTALPFKEPDRNITVKQPPGHKPCVLLSAAINY